MKDTIKKRIAILSVLLIAGLILAGVGNVLGAGEMIQGIVNEFTAKDKIVLEGNKATIYEDGKVVDTFLLKEMKEGEEPYSGGQDESNAVYMRNITKEEWEEQNTRYNVERNETMNEIFEISRKDPRLQELIEGKEYKISGFGRTMSTTTDENNKKYMLDLATISIEVEGERYDIKIDMNYGTVMSIKPMDPGAQRSTSVEQKPTPINKKTSEEMVKRPEEMINKSNELLDDIARKDPRVQELLEGKEYELYGTHGSAKIVGDQLIRTVTLKIRVESKEYGIVIDMGNETVLFVDDKEKLTEELLEIAKKDSRVQKAIEGRYYNVLSANRDTINHAKLALVFGDIQYGGNTCIIEIYTNNETVEHIWGDC